MGKFMRNSHHSLEGLFLFLGQCAASSFSPSFCSTVHLPFAQERGRGRKGPFFRKGPPPLLLGKKGRLASQPNEPPAGHRKSSRRKRRRHPTPLPPSRIYLSRPFYDEQTMASALRETKGCLRREFFSLCFLLRVQKYMLATQCT